MVFPSWHQSGRSVPEGRRSSEFLALLPQLHEAQHNLEQASVGLEKQFLATGSELQTLSAGSEQFVKQVEKLVGHATGQECDRTVFSNAIQLVEQSTQYLVGCQAETIQMLGLLRHYSTQIEKLLGVETELERTMMPLKFVQTLFKAESVRLGPEVQRMFGTLTQEIEYLHGQMREVFGTKVRQLEQTRQTIGLVITQLEALSLSLGQVTTTHKARIESSLETLKKEITSNQERDVRLDQVSRDLAHEVDQVVIGLQFQDIISQKLQHVTAALPQIEARITEFERAPDAAKAGEPLQFLQQSCGLEAEQLRFAQEELVKAETTIQGAIQKVLTHVTEMDTHCLSLEEFKLLTTSFDGMVQVLLETIEEVRDLVTTTVASAAKAFEMLQPLGGLASDLTTIVRSMSAQIHLIGLNAQVQAALAAQDSRGAALEVLSARTSEISEETNRISQAAATQLDQLAEGLAEGVQAFGQLRTDGIVQQEVINEQGRAQEQQLHAFRDRALDSLRGIGSAFDEIRGQAQRTLATVQFTQFHHATIPALRSALIAIGESAQRWLEAQGCTITQASLVEGFKRDYTMDSERTVYDGVMAAKSSPRPPILDVEPISEPSIELFTDLTHEDKDLPLRTEAAQAGGGDVAVPTPPNTVAVNKSELGDNVELF